MYGGISNCLRDYRNPMYDSHYTSLVVIPGWRFTCLCLSVIVISTIVVLRILMLHSPQSTSILQAIQAPYFRRFGYNIVESVRNNPDLYFMLSNALELGTNTNSNGQTPNQVMCVLLLPSV
ncbi:hypothetical protein FBUS_09815 [Fasciolopsis buskii]|uniref:Uncharacterized protein n=1 Tax=Fasciolopsis buskii TaxID=27845 RepID=A0A8E0VES0_9TREM|nr:hypothetical protein FBUS_09815 [Fasciolopsis buski]